MSRNLRNTLDALLLALPAVEGAVASWDFEPGAGDTLRDRTGNGHHGIIRGARWAEGLDGKSAAIPP